MLPIKTRFHRTIPEILLWAGLFFSFAAISFRLTEEVHSSFLYKVNTGYLGYDGDIIFLVLAFLSWILLVAILLVCKPNHWLVECFRLAYKSPFHAISRTTAIHSSLVCLTVVGLFVLGELVTTDILKEFQLARLAGFVWVLLLRNGGLLLVSVAFLRPSVSRTAGMLLWLGFLLATVLQCTILWFVGFNMGGSNLGAGLFILGILTIEYIIVLLLIVFGAAIDFFTHCRPDYD